MDWYPLIRLIHILSATVLFGTGMGTAFFMFRSWQSGNIESLKVTTRHVVQADWLFTSPAVVVQLLTGLWLVHRLSIPLDSVWLWVVLGLFALVGACWLPVVWIQIRVRDLLDSDAGRNEYEGLMRSWVALGIPAFSAVLVLFALMVYKPWLYQSLT